MSRTGRIARVAGGWACVGLGVLGLMLPGLPATCWFIAAAGLFAKGSPRLQRRMLAHPRIGPALRMWNEHRAMPRRAKAWAVGSMWAGIAPSLWLTARVASWLPWTVAAAGLAGTAVVLFAVRTLDGGARTQADAPAAGAGGGGVAVAVPIRLSA